MKLGEQIVKRQDSEDIRRKSYLDRLYGEEAQKRGLNSGGFWHDFVDWPHLQQRSGSVLRYYDWPEVDQKMRERFETEPVEAVEPIAFATPMMTADAQADKFIRVEGNKFCRNGKPFRFIGVNARGLIHYGVRYQNGPGYTNNSFHNNPRLKQLELAHHFGARALRVFLPYETATKEEIGDELAEALRIIKEDLRFNDLYILPL